jgi:hypothetical protein
MFLTTEAVIAEKQEKKNDHMHNMPPAGMDMM